jgi:hypothetical protein
MIKFTFITALLFLTSCTFSGQKLNCEKFKNGEFVIFIDSFSQETSIKRNGNFQTEIQVGITEPTELVVNWIDDCTYTLKPKDISLDKFKDLPENALVQVEIIEIKENSYIQKSTANFADFEIIREVHKIK